MKNLNRFFLTAALTLGLGAAAIVGGGWLAAKAMDTGIDAEQLPGFTAEAPASANPEQPDGMKTIMITPGNVITVAGDQPLRGTSVTDQTLIYEDAQPGEQDIDEQTAVATAIKAITQHFALKAEVLERFSLNPAPRFYSQYEDIDVPVWWVNLYPTNTDDFGEIGCYTAILDAATGEVLRLLSAADGKG